ncbi:hypothetical protein Godav_014612 [Gossypium davidsonii]|uniref:Uncharacterized protein n=1 Tax=Gossypium davidsonii TaxID=34287 RepID=A0A7J8RKC3_GOSDV|nr:hypothetical protein [Gossypium davidsonii]
MSNKRARISLDKAVVDVWQREVGEISARNFVKRLAASEDLVLRLDIYKKLDKHQGCVNTVSFNADGNVLVSGSDDTQVILWDWETGHTKLSFRSGHLNDVLQAKFMPYTDDRSLVICAADGEVNFLFRINLLLESCPIMRKFGCNADNMHRGCLADKAVSSMEEHNFNAALSCYCSLSFLLVYTRVINLNAITIDPRNPNLFALGGSDEYSRLYDLRKYKSDGSTDFGLPFDRFCPRHLINIGLEQNPVPSSSSSACSEASEIELAAMDADPQVYKGHRNCQTKGGELVRVMEADKHVVNCIESHPHTTVLASCGIEHDIKIWTPKAIEKAVLPTNIGQLLSWQSGRQELMDLMLTFSINSDASLDDGGNVSSLEDLFS